ncbi:hypothetical protein CK203_061974 [Vitis vinifera]|uniref:Uncharacterized protein n=1 Tax=Vitis vinifera TaxID=29760 RepID=A0A438FXU5_VITVI|nr:hypothetical protein CK203_061974 [Vitis vinifera]
MSTPGVRFLVDLKLTDEALMDEASKPDEALLVPEGASSGSEGSAKGAMGRDPLDRATELALVPVGSGYASPIAERETKIKEMNTGLVRSFGVGRHLDWRTVNSRGATECAVGMERASGRNLGSIKEVFGLIETKKGEALRQVVYWDEMEKCSALNLEDCEARKEARKSYKSWVLREEISWRQKSRELWLGGGTITPDSFTG